MRTAGISSGDERRRRADNAKMLLPIALVTGGRATQKGKNAQGRAIFDNMVVNWHCIPCRSRRRSESVVIPRWYTEKECDKSSYTDAYDYSHGTHKNTDGTRAEFVFARCIFVGLGSTERSVSQASRAVEEDDK
jgi:hypothetical protein